MNKIKVVQISTVDEGGAFKAANRLQDAIRQFDIDSQIIVRTKRNLDSDTVPFFSNPIQSFISKCKNCINLMWKRNEIFRDLLGTDISQNEILSSADIIIIHWINSFLSYHSLSRISELRKPVILVLHDMWTYTGGCHYDFYCNKYKSKCGQCPLIHSSRENDITGKNFLDKKKLYSHFAFTAIGPSRWSMMTAKESSLMKDKEILYIPNCYNEHIYFVAERNNVWCEKVNISTNKKILLFGTAHNSTANRVKGFSFLMDALEILNPDEYYLVIFGHADEKYLQTIKMEYYLTGYVKDENLMADIYRTADVFIAPSIQEAFGYTVCEAMACGTAVVGFDVGGIHDQIKHKENGYLAEVYNVKELSEGIEYTALHSEEMGKMAAISAKKYASNIVGKEYSNLFKRLL